MSDNDQKNDIVVRSRGWPHMGSQNSLESIPIYYDFIGSNKFVAYIIMVAIQLQGFGPGTHSREFWPPLL